MTQLLQVVKRKQSIHLLPLPKCHLLQFILFRNVIWKHTMITITEHPVMKVKFALMYINLRQNDQVLSRMLPLFPFMLNKAKDLLDLLLLV